jgi:uncharacterized protein YwgA
METVMNPNDFATLSLLALGGEVQGKTKLQKTIFFLALMTGRLEDLGYRAHFYGPYSDEVDSAVTWLKSIGAIDQNVTSWGQDPSGFELRRYDFRLNDAGKQFAEKKASQHPELTQRLKEAAGRLREAGEIGYMEMSIAAKTYFMLAEKKSPANSAELSRLARQFGWDVSTIQIERAIHYLERLNLVDMKTPS